MYLHAQCRSESRSSKYEVKSGYFYTSIQSPLLYAHFLASPPSRRTTVACLATGEQGEALLHEAAFVAVNCLGHQLCLDVVFDSYWINIKTVCGEQRHSVET